MADIFNLILTFIVGLAASFIGGMVGGGGLISIPFLIFLGLPPQVAIATNKFGAVGLSLGATYEFIKAKKIIWKHVLPFTLIGLVGAYLGAYLLLNINEELLSKFVGIAIVILLPAIFLKKGVGGEKANSSNKKKIIGYFIYFVIMIFGGFFGGGSGTLILYALMIFFGFTIIQANATDIMPWFFSSLLALWIFIGEGIVDFEYGIILFFGMLIGGYFGAKTAVEIGNRWVKIIFIIIVVASAIKLIFFY